MFVWAFVVACLLLCWFVCVVRVVCVGGVCVCVVVGCVLRVVVFVCVRWRAVLWRKFGGMGVCVGVVLVGGLWCVGFVSFWCGGCCRVVVSVVVFVVCCVVWVDVVSCGVPLVDACCVLFGWRLALDECCCVGVGWVCV